MPAFCRNFTCFMAFLLFFLQSSASAERLIRDTEIETVFQDAVQLMAEEAGFPDGINIRIVLDPSYNAFVAGGRTVYIHSGLLLSARQPRESWELLPMKLVTSCWPRPSSSRSCERCQIGYCTNSACNSRSGGDGLNRCSARCGYWRHRQSQRQYLSTSRKDGVC